MGEAGAGATSEEQVQQVRRLKLAGAEPLAVRDDAGALMAHMAAVSARDCVDPRVVSRLTDFRRANAERFFSTFEPSEARTRSWLERGLKDDQRILFLIRRPEVGLVGHFGLAGVTSEQAELDNALLGVRDDAQPRFFELCVRRVIQWAFEALKVRRVYARVLSENLPARWLNKRLGLRTESTKSLRWQEEGDECRLVSAMEGEPQDAEMLHMVLRVEEYEGAIARRA